MDQDEVLAILGAVGAAGMRVWVAGGWGGDALVGRQTRAHRDLDLLVDADRLEECLSVLAARGYAAETDWLPVRVEVVAAGQGSVTGAGSLRHSETGLIEWRVTVSGLLSAGVTNRAMQQ